jgi:hypothetical protein
MDIKLTEQLASNHAIDVLAEALKSLPGGAEALDDAILAHTTGSEDTAIIE